VKTYTPLAVLLTTDGFQVPVIPLVDVVGNVGTVPPEQIVNDAPKANAVIIFGVTVTVKVVAVAHKPAVGVNVYTPFAVLLTVAGLHVPVMPLLDVVGNVGTVPPEQMVSAVPKLKVGVTFGFTVTVNVVDVAHKPDVGVNVYTPPVVLLTVDGLQVPVMPLVEVFGNVGTVPPTQIDKVVPKLKVGVILGATVTVNVNVVAHKPAVGVNIYTPLVVLLTTAGFQVPVIPLIDVVGNVGTVPPEQMVSAVPKLKVGVIFGATVTVNVVVVAHKPAVGVNVYTPLVVLLTIAGFHVPVIPLIDVVGNVGTVPPTQIDKVVPKLKVGVIFGATVTVNVNVVAHKLAVGVNVYTPLVVLLTIAGFQVPVIPLIDVFGKTGTVPPEQMVRVVPKLKVGVIFDATVTVNVVVVAHKPAVGVNVYTPLVVLLTTAGFQVPVIPLIDVVGNVGTVPPAHILSDVPKLNAGTTFGFTVTVNVVVVAHKPAVGVNVYTPLVVLLTTDGFQVPVIPLVDAVGNNGADPPEQMVSVVPKLNVGVMFGATVTVNVVALAHKPVVGVNVYTPLAVLLTTAGFHVPVIPLVDVFGNVGTVPPEQILSVVPKLNVGVVLGVTVIVMVTGNPHWPAFGVNVYVPVARLFTTAGFHVPVTPLLDVVGNTGAVVPAQKGGIDVNVGINNGFDKITPVNRLVVHPLISKEKFE
jgi:hypothetical protein